MFRPSRYDASAWDDASSHAPTSYAPTNASTYAPSDDAAKEITEHKTLHFHCPTCTHNHTHNHTHTHTQWNKTKINIILILLVHVQAASSFGHVLYYILWIANIKREQTLALFSGVPIVQFSSLTVTSCTTIAMEIAMECVLIRDRNHVGERVNGFAGVWWLSR